MKLPVLLLLSCLGAGLAACGQKGPLYLPAENPEPGSGEQAPVKIEAPAKTDAPVKTDVPTKTEKPADAS